MENSPRDGGQGAFLRHIEAMLVEDSRRGEACTPAGCSREEDTRGQVENRMGRDGREEDEVSHLWDLRGADNLRVADGTRRQACKTGGEEAEGWRSGGEVVERWSDRMGGGWRSDKMAALVADSPCWEACMRVTWAAGIQGRPEETHSCCRLPQVFSAPCCKIARPMAGC